MLNISTGKLKNSRIKVTDCIRPTKSIVKSAVFNMLRSKINSPNACFLDAFAGSGNMGIEAISNGYRSIFIEKFRCVYMDLFDNLKRCNISFSEFKFSGLKKINAIDKLNSNLLIYGDSLKILNLIKFKIDILFIDPPYNSNLGEKILQNRNLIYLLSDESLILIETSRDTLEFPRDRFDLLEIRCYGDSNIMILRKI